METNNMRDTIKALYCNLFSPKERKKILQTAEAEGKELEKLEIRSLKSQVTGLQVNRDALFEENTRFRADRAYTEKRIEVVRANRNDIFETNKQLQATLNEANRKAERLAVEVENAETVCERVTILCDQTRKELKELRSEHEGKMDSYHEVTHQLQQQIRSLEEEVKHQRNRATSSDGQLVWLANWCKEEFGVENNDVIGKENWPNELVKVVAKVVNERVEELDDKIESLAASLRRNCE